MRKSYDNIAFIYDNLARLVYGKALINAQRYLIQAIPAGAHVLIVGGGTGWILEEITKLHPSGLTITYVDSSAKMIALAKARNAGANEVHYVAAPIESLSANTSYNVILTPFLFDNFGEELMRQVFAALHSRLQPQGIWLYCDFKDSGKWWQKAMLRVMYTFFRLFCGIQAYSLPDVEGCFNEQHYHKQDQQTFLNSFIIATVYKRQ